MSDQAQHTALKLLAARERTARALQRSLESRGFDPDACREAIDALRARGLLDDRRAGDAIARRLLARGPLARHMLVDRLVDEGIDPDLASQVADDALRDAVDGPDTLRTLLDGHHGRDRLRLARRLASRGFDEEALRELLDADAETDATEDHSSDEPPR